MKTFHMNIVHHLPDDFDGNLTDALRELADYRDKKFLDDVIESREGFSETDIIMLEENSRLVFSIFLERIKKGFRTVGIMSLGEVKNPPESETQDEG